MAEEVRQEEVHKATMHPSFLRVLKRKEEIKQKLSGIKHKIGIWSAKGGVGKTTVAVNLAYTLSSMGYRVGLLDADVDCPNLTMFLGIKGITSQEYPLRPVEKDGVKVLSTAMFLDDNRMPIIWRGPMVGKMISEFFENTEWGDLDYLILDVSPGTSDAPLSIIQLLNLDGFVLVTTPQHIAATNAIRSGVMARRLGTSILGVVENMSGGEVKGANEVVQALNCKLLGTVKMNPKLSDMSDKGEVAALKDNEIKGEFIRIIEGLTK